MFVTSKHSFNIFVISKLEGEKFTWLCLKLTGFWYVIRDTRQEPMFLSIFRFKCKKLAFLLIEKQTCCVLGKPKPKSPETYVSP